MPRPLTPAMLAALQSSDLQPVLFVQLSFANKVSAYLWSGFGQVAWKGQTWSGIGSLLNVGTIEDGSTVEARGITITVSGLDPNLLPECLTDFQLGQPVMVYFGVYANGALINAPLTAWAGRMDQPTIEASGDIATITINCENRLLDMNIPVDRRYTNQDQQMTWPGDLCFQFVDGIQEMTLFWGNYPNGTNNI